MSSLSTVEAKLPPGFRFHPRDEELVCDYLMKWISGCAHPFPLLIEVDLNKCEPWDIPVTARVGGKEWYFYCQRDRKYATGLRTNRATISGYWKATGKDRHVIRKGSLVGMRKTLVFYVGRAPKGRKTEWVMHEFRMEGTRVPAAPKPVSPAKEDWVLCRVFYKSRQEIPGGKTQLEITTENSYTYSYDVVPPSLPPLITAAPPPYNSITFNQTHQYYEQVPCFSIFNTTNQTNPNPSFSLITQMAADDPPPPLTAPDHVITPSNFPGDLYNPPFAMMDNDDPASNCYDKNVIRDVLKRLTKVESGINNEQCSMIQGSNSSFGGEGSSDSYLSEADLSSMWNQYS
ncbi:hypothetical protein ABFS82_13G149900 [Erythranthe guttata]|uniref:NAC domain-containing protein n=1 Tax=Erythranthe guttata TaxID=4155 RepID=A0A022QIZ7_ERYGU|nr:PREDICTED: NAC domain-containing protein 21/22 [Erythranthe guttata]EYU27529.1 hypothetical protein MIMGU_mgv1a009375mg [Erythranthe guttata]|eukprot:XP_012848909.1 PREDICTED: NAC domain-containing protein 21/22 [Erythranthe guttata]